MGSLGVAGGLNLLLRLLGEGDAEHTQNVAIGGLSLNEGLNERVPLLKHSAAVVAGDVHAVEVGIAVEALDFLDLEAHLLPGGGISRGVAVAKGQTENSSSEAVCRVDETGSLVHGRHGDAALLKAGGEDVVPLLLGERMNTKQGQKISFFNADGPFMPPLPPMQQ